MNEKLTLYLFLHTISFRCIIIIMTEPLPEAVKMLNQRLLAEGCLDSERAEEIWDNDLAQAEKGPAKSLKLALGLSNRQLAYAGMEIRGVVVEDLTYYAIVNKQPDGIAKMGFHSAFTTTEINYVRAVLEKLTDGGPCSKANLINLKNSLKEDDKLSMDQAVAIVERLVSEHWIWLAAGGGAGGSGKKDKRRHTMQAQMELAPRAYMELSYMLVEQFEVENDKLPQQIYFS